MRDGGESEGRMAYRKRMQAKMPGTWTLQSTANAMRYQYWV